MTDIVVPADSNAQSEALALIALLPVVSEPEKDVETGASTPVDVKLVANLLVVSLENDAVVATEDAA